MKKAFTAITVFVMTTLFAFTAVGCGGEERRGGAITRVEFDVQFDLPVSYTAELSVIAPDREYESKILQAAIEGFNEKYPNITITKRPLVIKDYNEIMMRQFKAGRLADIIWTDSSKYYFLVSNGIALNLDPFYEQADKARVFDYENDFSVDFRNMAKYGELTFAMPRSADSVVTFYNKEILAAAGVDLNPATTKVKNGWTWDDFLEVCEKVRVYYDSPAQKHTNYYPIDANLNWESVAYPIIKSLGGNVLDENGAFALSEEANAKVSALVKNLTDKRYVPVNNDSASNFETGTGAMLFQSTSIDQYQETQGTRNKFDVVSFPLINGENSAIGYGFAGYSLNKMLLEDQQKRNAACAFMAYLMSREGQQKLAKDGGLALPSIRTDLSINEQDAEWHKTYGDSFNVEAYTFGSQYKTELGFLGNVAPEFSADVIDALNSYVGKYAKEREAAEAYKMFGDKIKEVFASVVV